MSIDFVAQRYGILPSQLLRDGNSLDMLVADTAQGYQNYLQQRANGKVSIQEQYSQAELLDILNKSKIPSK
jgi:hypothetical protein